MRTWFTYLKLVFLDLWRLRRVVLPHIFVVAGICLPILLLQGLKRGHVDELRRDLLTSPTGREVRFWSANRGELLTRSGVEELRQNLTGVEVIIPDTQHMGTLSARGPAKKLRKVADVTFDSTCAGDPLLKLASCDVLTEGEHAVVLNAYLASQLGVSVGDTIDLSLTRANTGQVASLPVTVKAIMPGDEKSKNKIAYLDVRIHDQIERFLSGYAVPELRWPATTAAAADEYAGYLIFCEPPTLLTTKDQRFLTEQKGYILEKVTDEETRQLHGLLKPHQCEVHYITTKAAREGRQRMRQDPNDLKDKLEADALILPWNPTQEHTLAGVPHRLIGLSLPGRTWLRGNLWRDDAFFAYDAPPRSVAFPFTEGQKGPIELPLTLRQGPVLVNLTIKDLKSAPPAGVEPPGPKRAVIPVQMLAHLTSARSGTVQYDPINQIFVPVPNEIEYSKGRLYAHTIDEVPTVVSQLLEREFAIKSENARIREIQKQNGSLVFIVFVVGVCVLVFGVFTVTNVLSDSTARKQGTIGVLRVMGVSRVGVFCIVFLRAAMIGVLAGGLALTFGLLAALLLRLVPVTITFTLVDLVAVFGSAIACCVLGSLYPAWVASRVDPYETIVEGKFR